MYDNNNDKEIIEQEKNINLEINKHNLNNNSNFEKDNLKSFQMENLGNENSNINTKQINKENNWTEILYNIVDNFSDESSFEKNSEESIKTKDDKKEKKIKLKKQIIIRIVLKREKIT